MGRLSAWGWFPDRPLFPFVSSEVETPIEAAPGPRGISTSLDANGISQGLYRPDPDDAIRSSLPPELPRHADDVVERIAVAVHVEHLAEATEPAA